MARVIITIEDMQDGAVKVRLENDQPLPESGPTDAQLIGHLAAEVCASCGDVESLRVEPFNPDGPEPSPEATGPFVVDARENDE
jgi:hypothetical protein